MTKAQATICQSCGTPHPSFRNKYKSLGIESCTSCGSLRFRADSEIDFSGLYSKNYFHEGEYKNYLGHQAIHRLNFKRKWDILRPFLDKNVQLFEVGCAYGIFVDFARHNGADKAYGSDISEDAIRYACEHFGPHFSVATPGCRPPFAYNTLVAWDVWEHLEQPLSFFSELVGDLAPGGLFAITTVDSSSAVARLRGPRWRQIHPPTHMHYPTKRALVEGLGKLGLEIVYQRYFGYHRALEQYVAAFKLDRALSRFPRLMKAPFKLDLKDTQFIIARKRQG